MPRAGDAVDAILFDLGGVLIELVGVEQMLAWSPQLADTAELWRRCSRRCWASTRRSRAC